MAGVLDDVDRRTQLVGENRLELLLFRLNGTQLYGINVFKVQEVIRCPKLTQVPRAKQVVYGIANMRGKTIPVIDLGFALGTSAIQNVESSFVIIADYNRSIQGFMVSGVERIVNMNWEDILAPPKGSGAGHYLTAVTRVDDKLVEIIDVEKVLHEIGGIRTVVSKEVTDVGVKNGNIKTVLVADDSTVARNQIKKTLDQLGIECVLAKDGKEALDYLEGLTSQCDDITDQVELVISDVEMPNMDGYTLTTMIRKDPKLQNLYVILHTSLSGVFNRAMVKKVGANEFIPKFSADDLAHAVIKAIDKDET
ncbi:MAG: chemotaxis protein CheV [Gammaproteobacteria bacterium]|nr:chemotaxis protein CheV [Gammaproteobacteria bacterium]